MPEAIIRELEETDIGNDITELQLTFVSSQTFTSRTEKYSPVSDAIEALINIYVPEIANWGEDPSPILNVPLHDNPPFVE